MVDISFHVIVSTGFGVGGGGGVTGVGVGVGVGGGVTGVGVGAGQPTLPRSKPRTTNALTITNIPFLLTFHSFP